MAKSKDETRTYNREYNRLWRAANRDKSRKAVSDYRKRNPAIVERANKNAKLKAAYGLTFDQFIHMLEDQGYCCAICINPLPLRGLGTHVDHNHATGKVRAILCTFCNNMLGNAKENIQILQAGINYLKRFSGS